MNLLLNPRGTHGSGKSYVMRAFLEQHKLVRKVHSSLGARMPEAYELRVADCAKPVFVLGPYQTVCGGLDCIRPYDHIMPLIDKYAEKGHVVFEGMLASGVYGRLGAHLEQYKKRVHLIFLDTPLDLCVERVRARRTERGVEAIAWDPVNVRKKWMAVKSVKKRVEEEKIFRSTSVSSNAAAAYMARLLREAS